MRPIYEPTIQAQMDAYLNQINRVEKALYEEYKQKLEQQTGHIQNALNKLYSESIPVRYELTEWDKIELEEMNNGK